MNTTALDREIQRYCAENRIMGVVKVTVRDTVAFEGRYGYADIEGKLPFTDASMFRYYSMSKPFAAIGFLKLVEKGLVDLSAHPGKYLPEAGAFDSRATLDMLLHHTAGFPDYAQTPAFAEKYRPGRTDCLRAHTRALSGYPQLFVPGTECFYENISFILPALISENITGKTWAEYVTHEVLRPLGMTRAIVDNENRRIAERVTGYAQNGVEELVPVEPGCDWMLAAGDIVSTVDEAYCLNLAYKNRLLLKPETWDYVMRRNPVGSYGVGCAVSRWHGKQRITHNGGHTGFRTLHIWLPEDDFDILFFSNCGFGDARNAVSEIIFAYFYGRDDCIAQTGPKMDGFLRESKSLYLYERKDY